MLIAPEKDVVFHYLYERYRSYIEFGNFKGRYYY